MLTRRHGFEALAAGGVVGPVGFVSAWAVSGTVVAGYSPARDAISRLAAVGASTRPVMSAGLVLLGLGLPLYGLALRSALPGPAWITAAATGMSTLAVAALPLGSGSGAQDRAHGVAALLGYVTLAATPALSAAPLRAAGRPGAAAISIAVGAACAVALMGTGIDSLSGAFQRVGLTLGHLWIAASAVGMIGLSRTRS